MKSNDLMTLSVKQEFSVRYYRWSMDYAQREAANSFPVLRSIKNVGVYHALSRLEPLKPEQRTVAVSALVKRFHAQAAILAGQPATEDEQDWIDGWNNSYRKFSFRYQLFKRRKQEKAVKQQPVDLKVLAKSLHKQVSPILGKRIEITRKTRVYESYIAGWRIETYIDLGLFREPIIGYWQRIWGEYPFALHEFISPLSWMGISSGTIWEQLTADDVEPAISSMVQLCSEFMNALPSLLDGLQVPKQHGA